MWENEDQNNSEYRHFLLSAYFSILSFSFDGPGSSNMALIDVTMVSGFEPILHELDIKLQSRTAEFSYYEFNNGKLSFYYDKVSMDKMNGQYIRTCNACNETRWQI